MTLHEQTAEWVIWKLSAINDTTHRFSESELRNDIEFDLGKSAAKALPLVFKQLITQNKVKSVNDKFCLVGKELYTSLKPHTVAPLEISDEARALQATLRSSAIAEWKQNPQKFWIEVDGTYRMGKPFDVFNGKLPLTLRR